MFEPHKRACFSHPDRIYTLNSHLLALKAHFIIKSHAYAFVEIFEASSTNSVDPDLTAPVGAVRSRSTLFALYLCQNFRMYELLFCWRFKSYVLCQKVTGVLWLKIIQ